MPSEEPRPERCEFTDLITTQCAHCIQQARTPGRTEPGPAAAAPARPATAALPRPRTPPARPCICLACGGTITPDQPSISIPIARGTTRRRHARDQDCRHALAQPPGGNSALIGTYTELPAARIIHPRPPR